MKIEKVNDNQIRCTLTKEDLANRELKISELAYGTEKAKSLFRDMMQQANFEFGFEAEDIPLMIEAIPMNTESIVLIITKVEDPEELDTRFSRFAPSIHDDEDEIDDFDNLVDSSSDEEILDLFKKLHANQQTEGIVDTKIDKNETMHEPNQKRIRLYHFSSLQTIIYLAGLVSEKYNGTNCLYKDSNNQYYLLLLSQGEDSPELFNKISNVVSEYGTLKKVQNASLAYFEEHYETIIPENALQVLSKISS